MVFPLNYPYPVDYPSLSSSSRYLTLINFIQTIITILFVASWLVEWELFNVDLHHATGQIVNNRMLSFQGKMGKTLE